MRISEDFPEPLRPSTTQRSPASTAQSTPRRRWRPSRTRPTPVIASVGSFDVEGVWASLIGW